MNELCLCISVIRTIVCNFFLDLWKWMKGEQVKKGKDSLDELAEQLGCSRIEKNE